MSAQSGQVIGDHRVAPQGADAHDMDRFSSAVGSLPQTGHVQEAAWAPPASLVGQ